MTHLVNDCLGDVNSSVSSGFRLHAALSASLGLLLGLPLGLGGFLAEHGGEVEHIGGHCGTGSGKILGGDWNDFERNSGRDH